MELKRADRLGTRLLAINIRLAELSHEMEQTQIRVHRLESELEDARLARMMGEEGRDPGTLGTELEASRGSLESQRELVEQVKKSQWDARVRHTLAKVQQRRQDRERESARPEEGGLA